MSSARNEIPVIPCSGEKNPEAFTVSPPIAMITAAAMLARAYQRGRTRKAAIPTPSASPAANQKDLIVRNPCSW